MEVRKNSGFNYFKILNIIIQFAIFGLYLVRYMKFIKVKEFFFDNKYFYKNKNEENVKGGYYFPNKVFNIDSFPLAISINILLFNILYLIIPKKYHCTECKMEDCTEDDCCF